MTMTRLSIGLMAALIASGCGSDSRPVDAPPVQPQRASRTATSPPATAPARVPVAATAPAGLDGFRAGVVAGQEQVDRTLAALADLTAPNQADVRGAYDRYCEQLTRMEDHARLMKQEADAMRASRDQYFGRWEEKIGEIENPTIRASAEARRKRLRDAHERIATSSGEARDAYEPFMDDLQDIKKFLATNLSKDAVADLSDAAQDVQRDGAVVREKLAEVVTTLDTVKAGE
jgi:hypothetical protein